MEAALSVTADTGFHAGELAVQDRAGVRDEAARLAPMLEAARLGPGIAAFLGGRTFAALTARDEAGCLWVSPLTGPAGFLEAASAQVLNVHARPAVGDPLHVLPPGQKVGLVVMAFASRRRVRLNGVLTGADDGALAVEIEQAYGNCPRYICPRPADPQALGSHGDRPRISAALSPQDAALISAAHTFFLGTSNPERGRDASHRGGPAGFARVLPDGRIRWPDFPGNGLFNSLGNLAVDSSAALLFLDFASGGALHLSGTAKVEWDVPSLPGGTGRDVAFAPQQVVSSIGRCLPGAGAVGDA